MSLVIFGIVIFAGVATLLYNFGWKNGYTLGYNVQDSTVDALNDDNTSLIKSNNELKEKVKVLECLIENKNTMLAQRAKSMEDMAKLSEEETKFYVSKNKELQAKAVSLEAAFNVLRLEMENALAKLSAVSQEYNNALHELKDLYDKVDSLEQDNEKISSELENVVSNRDADIRNAEQRGEQTIKEQILNSLTELTKEFEN